MLKNRFPNGGLWVIKWLLGLFCILVASSAGGEIRLVLSIVVRGMSKGALMARSHVVLYRNFRCVPWVLLYGLLYSSF